MEYIGQRIKIVNMDEFNGIREPQAYINKLGFIIKDYGEYHRFMIHYDIDYMNIIDAYNGHVLMQESNVEVIEPPKNIYGGTGDCIGFVPSCETQNWTDEQWADYDQYRKYMGLSSREDMGNAINTIVERFNTYKEKEVEN